MSYLSTTYLIYISVTITLTIFVANYLFKNGKVFLHSAFRGAEHVANAINNLLKMGFYLVNIGYALTTIRIAYSINRTSDLIEILSVKIGVIVLILGVLHFFNMYILYLIGKFIRDKKTNEKKISNMVEFES